MAKTKKQKSIFTPFRISVGLNILLSIIVIAGVSGYMYVKNAYNNGSQSAAQWGTIAIQNYCSNPSETQKLMDVYGSLDSTNSNDKKAYILQMNTLCDNDGTWGPYYEKALKAYYKDNGVDY